MKLEITEERLQEIINKSLQDAENNARESLPYLDLQADEMTMTAVISFLKGRLYNAIINPETYKY